jgi:hypothetical protein
LSGFGGGLSRIRTRTLGIAAEFIADVARDIGSRARSKGRAARASIQAQGGGGDGREQLLGRDVTEEAQQQARMVGQEDQTPLPGNGRLDQIELGVFVPRFVCSRIGSDQTVVTGAHQTVQVGVALLALDQNHQATRPAPVVGEFGPQDGPAGRGAGRIRLGGAQEVHHARHTVHIGQGQGPEVQLPGPRQELGGGVGAREQRVVAVDAEGDVHARGSERANPNKTLMH